MEKNIKAMEKNFISYIKKFIFQNGFNPVLDKMFDYFDISDCDYYIVGGIIRDYLLGKIPKDIDIAFEGDFESLIYFMNKNISHYFIVNKKFNTLKIFINGGEIDIINCRHEKYLLPGALPTITPDSIYEDMKRRDITINSIAYSFKHAKFIDILSGIDDLKKKTIKLNSNVSFYDDPSRIYRIIKYKNRYKFNYDNFTDVILQEAIKNNLLENISKERQLNEFVKILNENNLENIFSEMYKLGILKNFLPKFQYDNHHINKIKNFNTIKDKTESKLLMLYYIFDNNIDYVLSNFSFSKNLRINLENIKELKKDLSTLRINSTHSEIYYVFSKYSDLLLKIAYILEKTKIKELIDFYSKILRHVSCPINGTDLINRGIMDPQRIKRILKAALMDTLDDKNLMLTKDEILMKYTQSVKL